MRLFAFRGTRYGIDDPGALAAPPFDQIDPRRRAELHAAHPRQFAHLTRPDSPADAARLLAEWAADGTVANDDAPCLYAYEIRLAAGGRRLGLCGLIGLEDPATGVIRPHESTVDKTIDERLELLEATRTDLEPILVLCERSAEFEALLERAGSGEPLVSHTDEFGHSHRLFKIADPATCDRFKQLLAPSPGWIADGHHRYRVASEFARRHAPPAGTPAAAKLAVVTSLASPGLRIDPIHRALGVAVNLDAAADAIVARNGWHPSASAPTASGAALASAVAAAPQPAIGVYPRGGEPEIWRLEPAAAPHGWPEPARGLAAALLHTTLYERFGLGPSASHDGTTGYRSDPDQLWDEVESGETAVGIWLPPTSPELFAGAVAAGDRLPPKWTRFVPKLVSGLVWCPHDAEVA